MARYTITPWRHQADLLNVRQNLYNLNGSGTDLRRQTVDRVMAWKLRGNLPHAVESTALLVDAILHHNLAHNSIFSVRAVYSAAFTRFVTGFCDIGRNRERALEPSSMLEIARQIGMPPEFVALRHEATHEELPSVQRLVTVCGQALDWLWKVYWERLDQPTAVALPAETDIQHVRNESRRIFKEFRGARKQALKAQNVGSQVNVDLVQKTAHAITALCGDRESAIDAIAQVLVNDGMLYPSDRE
jgi:ribosomal biogenesis protein LAS1